MSAVAAERLADDWKAHVLQCGLCGNAKGLGDLCPIGRNFWQPSKIIASDPPVVLVQPPAPQYPPPQYVPPQPQQPQYAPIPHGEYMAQPPQYQQVPVQGPPAGYPGTSAGTVVDAIARFDHSTAARLGEMVASRVVARSASGGAIAIPMEKTSKAVSFSTAPGVQLYMPERDIEVYSEMKVLISRLMRIAQVMSNAIAVSEETRRVVRSEPVMQQAPEEQVAMVVRHARARFGVGSDESLFNEFMEVTQFVLRIGDRLGNLMRVDEPTQRIIRAARTLAIDMQGELERVMGDQLKMDEETRRLVKPMRLLAVDLQGEIERRVGTP